MDGRTRTQARRRDASKKRRVGSGTPECELTEEVVFLAAADEWTPGAIKVMHDTRKLKEADGLKGPKRE